jgi:release factor glutamine methyltransferase
VAEALEEARSVVALAGIKDPRREAAELYAAVVGGATSAAWLDAGREIPPAVERRLLEAASRRAAGWPQAYATGRTNFRGHWLVVDRRVLIPRPETEGLVELVIAWSNERAARGEGRGLPVVADVGTGSGAIAISLALEAKVSGVIATDVSDAALSVATENAGLLGVRERISLRRGALLLPLMGESVDAIVSNPPYVRSDEWDRLDPSVRDHEPRLALDGGEDGLGVIRELVRDAWDLIIPGGLLALEVDAARAESSAVLVRDAGFEQVEVGRDPFGRPRYVTARRREIE